MTGRSKSPRPTGQLSLLAAPTAASATTAPPGAAVVLSVRQLNQKIRAALDADLAEVWVSGEISTFRVAPSSHCYFILKDGESQIAAVMFRSAASALKFRPEDGMSVVVRGRVSLYDVRGTLQLYVEAMEPCGLGSLQLAFEQLKQKLAAEGLFDVERKRSLPYFPRTIGIVTALRGAALRDMLVTLERRCPGVRILIRPSLVQGREAPDDIVAALADLGSRPEVEVAIVGRGGGSLEDLWAFNDERVARAIVAAPFPIISAVGHESDFTIADLVADLRAATPTAAAALVSPDHIELRSSLARLAASLEAATLRRLQRCQQQIDGLRRQLRDPRATLKHLQLRVDDLNERAARAMAVRLERHRHQLSRYSERLHALSPLAVLQRGYAIVRRQPDGGVLTRSADVSRGDHLRVVLFEGSVDVRVEGSTPGTGKS